VEVFVLSLPDAGPRRAPLLESLERQGVGYEVVPGVAGETLAQYDEQIDWHLALRTLGEPLLPGEAGCALGHRSIYQRMREANVERAVILEDDAVLAPDFGELLKTLDASPEDMVLLHHCYSFTFPWSRLRRRHHGRYKLLPATRTPCSTVGYYLTLRAAQRLERSMTPLAARADWPIPVDREFGAKLLAPCAVFHNTGFASQIADRSYPKSNRVWQYIEALSFHSYRRDKARHGGVRRFVAGHLLSAQVHHAPPPIPATHADDNTES